MYVGINNWANETSRYILNENSLVENVFIEINIRSKNWFFSCSDNTNLTSKQSQSEYKQRSRFLSMEIRQLYLPRRF